MGIAGEVQCRTLWYSVATLVDFYHGTDFVLNCNIIFHYNCNIIVILMCKL